jgi:hypothetical protein
MGGESAKMVGAYISARAGLKGHDDAIHTIHAGTDHNVELRLSDLKVVIENYAALLEALQGVLAHASFDGIGLYYEGLARAAIARATGAA